MEKIKPEKERLIASPALWNAILSEFSDLRYISEGEQLRKSPDPLFARSAIHGLSIISILDESYIQSTPKVLQVAPINEIATGIRNFRDFTKGMGQAIENDGM